MAQVVVRNGRVYRRLETLEDIQAATTRYFAELRSKRAATATNMGIAVPDTMTRIEINAAIRQRRNSSLSI